MEKQFKIEVDCANCASKIEAAISKINGIDEAHINFIMGKMNVKFDEGADEKKLLKQMQKVARKIEPDCEIYL
ncbi:MAG: heavy-metal-associated domain-containing protein [Clostridia bacterium]|nr:heavy-metal-associated domain-containing protein [Clostridia bacterium]